jgi:hypothetical protein
MRGAVHSLARRQLSCLDSFLLCPKKGMQEQERDCQSMLGLKGDKGFDMECGQGKHIQQKKETIDK